MIGERNQDRSPIAGNYSTQVPSFGEPNQTEKLALRLASLGPALEALGIEELIEKLGLETNAMCHNINTGCCKLLFRDGNTQ